MDTEIDVQGLKALTGALTLLVKDMDDSDIDTLDTLTYYRQVCRGRMLAENLAGRYGRITDILFERLTIEDIEALGWVSND